MWHSTPVAVKILNPVCQQELHSRKLIASFTDEITILAHIRHPNICLFMGACMGSSDTEYAIITEYVSQGSLWDVLRRDRTILFPNNPPEYNTALYWPNHIIHRVLEGACMGLLYLHKHIPPIIHRDLKSANLLLTENFQIKIWYNMVNILVYNLILYY